MRLLSITMRHALSNQETGEVAVVLLTIRHPMLPAPIRLSSDPTQRLSNVPLTYGTVSRGHAYLFFPFSHVLPDEVDDRAPAAQIQIENVSRDLIQLLRSANTSAKVDMELVLASAPDNVEIEYLGFDLSAVTYNAEIVTLELTIDSLDTEPYPAGKFTPAGFPGLFG